MNKKNLLALAALLAGATLASCNGNKPSEDNSKQESTSQTQTLLEFKDVKFDSKTIVYDGNEHTLEVEGAPEGTNIKYTGKGNYKDAGTYQMSAELTKDGYKEKTLNAVLTISKATFGENIVMSDVSVEYDEVDHKDDVKVVGSVPEGSSITYVVKKDNKEVNEAKEVGEYEITATISNKNYEIKTLKAKLTISAVEDALPIKAHQGVIYFANGLHKNYLYSYDQTVTSAEPALLSTTSPTGFFTYGNNLGMFSSVASIMGSVSSVTKTQVSSLLSTGLYSYVCANGNYLYYAQNMLTNDQSGIYKVDLTVDEATPVKIYSGKAYYLQYANGDIYFADGRNDKKLSKVSSSRSSSTTSATLITDSSNSNGLKIKSLIVNNNVLYFNVNNLLGDYIGKYTINSSSFKKITSTQGKYLTVIGSNLYFSNNDLVTEATSGKGIYKVPTDGGSITKVVNEPNGINYVTYDEITGSLVYTRSTDLHVISYNLGTNASKDILNGFVAPTVAHLNTGGKTVVHGNNVYFLNMFEGKTLCRYAGNKTQKITTNKVEDYAIIGNKLYFNQVSKGVNNDTFMADLTTGDAPVMISSDDLRDFVSDGSSLYCVKYNALGAATAMIKMGLDGSNPIEFYLHGATNLRINNGNLYFLDGDKIKKVSLSQTSSIITPQAVDLAGSESIDHFEIYNDFVVYDFGGTITNKLAKAPLSNPGTETILASSNTNPIDFVIEGTNVYYYSFVKSRQEGAFYKVSVNATADGSAQKLYDKNSSDQRVYGRDLAVLGTKLFFQDYYVTELLGTSHTCYLDLNNLTADPVAID